MWKTVIRAIVVVVVGGALWLGVGVAGPALFGLPSSPPVAVCPTVAAVQVGSVSVPSGPVAGYCQDRLVNAAYIMSAAQDLGLGTRTQTVGVMTALGESGLRVLSYGDTVGVDSRGLFQQRDNGAWGTLADRMDPVTSARNFFITLTGVPGWETMRPTLLAHAVQVNADPNHYTPYWADAQAIVAALSGP